VSVTVVSCVYGSFDVFVPRWKQAIAMLDPAPDDVIVASDKINRSCPWKHPQAWHLNAAIFAAETDWVWIVDIDDCALPEALDGLDQVAGDVWQMGYIRSDGREIHIPNESALTAEGNLLTAGSAVRVDAFHRAGGFPDVAFQDWALWRRLQAIGAKFEFSGRTHYRYMRHGATRTETELFPKLRQAHIDEMMEAELAHA
jgi:hypothetical protein